MRPMIFSAQLPSSSSRSAHSAPSRSASAPPQRAQSACPLCGSHEAHRLAERDGKTGAPLKTIVCDGCGLGRIDPLPTPQELARWYSQHYRQDYKAAHSPAMRHVLRAARIARDRWHWLQQRHALSKGARALDVGASSGEFVAALGCAGLNATGLEPHQGYAGFARTMLGLDVRNAGLDDIASELPQTRFSVISMFHVLEHLVEPVAQLRRLAALLETDGVLFLEVPDTRRMCAPHTLYFRAHTLHFTPQTLRALARAAGLDVVAHNFDQPDNLRVLLKRQQVSAQDAPSANPQPGAADVLLQAQARRSWPAYLAHTLLSGALWRKHLVRVEEKQTAARFAQPKALLDAVFDGLVKAQPAAQAAPRAPADSAFTSAGS
jgi:2-polyprenyl-3-methyl-5-hydroxy-6-metoxy-1,4-benzoquinol methylase